MTDQKRFGENDHEPLATDDILSQAIGQWRDATPATDLWPGVAARLEVRTAPRRTQVSFTLPQLAMAASLLMAVASGVTWLAARQPAAPVDPQPTVVAQSESTGEVEGGIVNANFADAQFNAAVTDLEQILRSERDRLDPRTVLVIERNLKTIDLAIQEARMALNDDPANAYLNSHLADARRRKLDLLRHATTLSAGGD
jgi:negative regulator of sigma E activity